MQVGIRQEQGDAVSTLLTGVLNVGRRAIASASSLSITLMESGAFTTTHATADEARELDGVQFGDRAGPTVDAVLHGERSVSRHDADRSRWQQFSHRAAELGITETIATPLRSGTTTYGALTIYCRDGNSLSGVELELVQALADEMSSALALMDAAALNEQLSEAIATRQVIGEAKGILMESQGCTRDEAFDMLRRASQRTNRKLHDIAEEVVQSAERRARRR